MHEQLEVLRRIADRGMVAALKVLNSEQVALWQHMSNEIQVAKRAYESIDRR